MRVVLAYPRDGHAADDVIDVDDETGRVLVQDGFARLAPEKSARTTDKKEAS